MIVFKFSVKELPQSLQSGFKDEIARIKRPILQAIGAKLKLITVQNIGASGIDRSSQWEPLSKRYAKRVGRDYATMEKSGALLRGLRMDVRENDNAVDVYVHPSIPYADRHQFGRSGMPYRPYFPVNKDGTLTEYARAQIVKKGIEVATRLLAS